MFNAMIETLKANPKKIVFTEGHDARILEATDRLVKGGFLTPLYERDPSRKVIFCLFMPSLIIDFLLIPLIFHALVCIFFVSGVDF